MRIMIFFYCVILSPIFAALLVLISHDPWWIAAWPAISIGSLLIVLAFEKWV